LACPHGGAAALADERIVVFNVVARRGGGSGSAGSAPVGDNTVWPPMGIHRVTSGEKPLNLVA